MKRPIRKPKQLSKAKIQKQLKGTAPISANKKVMAKKPGAKPFGKSKPEKIKVKLTETGVLKNFETENIQLTRQLEQKNRALEIEAALEKVRSRTMAMQRSEELGDVAEILFKQVQGLGIHAWTTGFNIWQEGNESYIDWVTNPSGGFMEPYTVDLTTHPVFREISDAKKRGEDFHVFDTSGKPLEECYALLISFAPKQFEGILASGIPFPTRQINHYVYGAKVGLMFITPEPCPDAWDIFKRFGKVFEQTYTRFLDLQKAEAQAREAKIEAALEKVRSRSLAMHKTDELKEVIAVVFEKLHELGVPMDGGAHIAIYNDEVKGMTNWLAAPDLISAPMKFYLPYHESPVLSDFWEARPTGLEYLSKVYPYEEKSKFFNYIFTHTDYKGIPENVKELVSSSQSYAYSSAVAKYSGIVTHSHLGKILSEPDREILKRFVKVFEQAYTRFLDLQKAEAQTGEAQIQLAMERVRARTMAMQHSDELKDAAALLFQQAKTLGVPAYSCGYNIWEKDEKECDSWMSSQDGSGINPALKIPLTEDANFIRFNESRQKGEQFYVLEMRGKRMQEHYQYLRKTIPVFREYFDYSIEAGFPLPETQIHHLANFSHGNLMFITLESCPEFHDVFKRFAAVFEQTYTRFLDLQKAERQAREATIEASLERVRASAMAMHNSEDVVDATGVLFKELHKLAIENMRCGILIIDEDQTMEVWSVTNTDDGKTVRGSGRFNMNDHPLWQGLFKAWKQKEELYYYNLAGEDKHAYYRVLANTPNYFSAPLQELPDQNFQGYYFPEGTIWTFSQNPHSEEDRQVLKKFTAVFSLTFRRFRDLKKAEAQAREATIEAALEKVRGKAMAMHNSQDLAETISVFYREMRLLSVTPRRVGVALIDKETRLAELSTMSTTGQGGSVEAAGSLKMAGHWLLDAAYDHWLRQEEYHAVLKGNQIKEYYQLLKPQISYPDYANDVVQYGYYFMFPEGDVVAWTEEELQEEELMIYRRFTTVISLTYKRYMDLQRAEAQAREATIEAALEKVRGKAMAMHNSNDLIATASIVFSELRKLGINSFRSGVGLFTKESRKVDLYSATTSEQETSLSLVGWALLEDHPVLSEIYDSWMRNEDYFPVLKGELLKTYYEKINSTFTVPLAQSEGYEQHGYFLPFSEGVFYGWSEKPYSETEIKILKRFKTIVDLTFRRYMELKNAEAQAQEAKIEASLERVRGKALAMHSSEDLTATIGVFYHELETFSLTPRRCGVGLLDKDTHIAEISTMNTTEQGDSFELVGRMNMQGHPVLEGIYDNWILQQEYHPVLRGKEIAEYYQLIRPHVAYPVYPNDAVQYGYFFFFQEGGVFAWTENELSEDELKIYRRFTSVLSLAYKRYKDLKDAEARTQIAIRESSLDRVRAGIASMRTAVDLNQITPLIWRELKALGVPFFRCGVMIANEKSQFVDFYLSTPENKPLAALHLGFESVDIIRKAMESWREQTVYRDHWNREQFAAFAKSMIEQGQIQTVSTYQGGEEPPESTTMQYLPFAQGMLYVGSAEPLSESQIDLAKALAEAFSTAYARYEDFTKLESAKQQIEKTLVDLKQTQAQLVQSEKMASLGELTAGIAHEIQNPLNFVNNFSEVSNELIEEMMEEVKKGNYEEVKTLADNIKQNLEKINHHGKRADGIVKGMLQHSRSSSGVKEPTNINVLADEYLRLAYHGLRARDKSFNAKFETVFDEKIGNINVIPQDIGRVVLNLITNAFYTVTEKKKATPADKQYEPTVIVSTKRVDNKVLISVKDNGNGIPQKVLDKIFQPFFTTKPTGQGTGLGLSMSYDIVKAHGGEITVNSKEGEGSEFSIHISLN